MASEMFQTAGVVAGGGAGHRRVRVRGGGGGRHGNRVTYDSKEAAAARDRRAQPTRRKRPERPLIVQLDLEGKRRPTARGVPSKP